jgi:hypothetical protein
LFVSLTGWSLRLRAFFVTFRPLDAVPFFCILGMVRPLVKEVASGGLEDAHPRRSKPPQGNDYASEMIVTPPASMPNEAPA